MDEVDPRQLDLFDERNTRLAEARTAFEAFDLREAKRRYEAVLERYPDDGEVRGVLELVNLLVDRLAALEASTGSFLEALTQMGELLRSPERKAWHRRVAEEAEKAHGPGCMVDDNPVGLHWLMAGDPGRAAASLRDSLSLAPGDGRLLGYLGDALHVAGDRDGSRGAYLQAFLADPMAVDLSRVEDHEVLGLVLLVEEEYGIDCDAEDWVAAAGTVEGVFDPPVVGPSRGETALPDFSEEDAPGRAFYRAMVAERSARSHEDRVAARRRMKELCPALLAAYLERFR